MGNYVIHGGRRLAGEVSVNGSKNAVLPIMAATILNGGRNVIHNCPNISDIETMSKLLQDIGCLVKREGKTMIVDSSQVVKYRVREDLTRRMRSSIVCLGAMLGRFRCAEVSYPGGCEIGARPIDMHLKAFQKMGAEWKEEKGVILCQAREMRGTKINLNYPSVGATENIMLAGALAKGRTIIYSAAREPEIVDLQNYLRRMGARVYGAGSDVIIIDGVETLKKEVEYTVIGDRIEAGTYLAAAAITNGEVFLRNIDADCMRQTLLRLAEAGCVINEEKTGISLIGPKRIKPIETLRTLPYPGFPTDMQPQFTSLLTLAQGTSIIIETVFESRYRHMIELCRMGANITLEGQTAVIKGVSQLVGTTVYGADLRGGAGLILAGLRAQGETVVCESQYVERGYEQIEKVLTTMGADITLTP